MVRKLYPPRRTTSYKGVRMSPSSKKRYAKATAASAPANPVDAVVTVPSQDHVFPAVPSMRWDVVNHVLGGAGRYLEIGVQSGAMGRKVVAEQKWGVDPSPTSKAASSFDELFVMPSDQFFDQLSAHELFDVVFVDGLHESAQVLRDVDNALRHLRPGGFVLLHDCNPQSEPTQRVPRETGVWNGDCWKAMVELRRRPDLTSFTIDMDEGIGVVMREPNPGMLTKSYEMLTYETLVSGRQELLGLTNKAEWTKKIPIGSVTVVTANFGDRDRVHPVPSASDVDRCLLFTDSLNGEVAGWQTTRLADVDQPRLEARRVKTKSLDLVAGDVLVWMDGRVRLKGAPIRAVLRRVLGSSDVGLFPHPWRRCLFSEIKACARERLAPLEALAAQAERYRKLGMPKDFGLWNTMVMAQKRSTVTAELGNRWWAEISRHSVRDQVSLPFLLWQMGLVPGLLGIDVHRRNSSPFWLRGQHR